MSKVGASGKKFADSFMGRAWVIFAAVLGFLVHMAPSAVLYELGRGLEALLVFPLEMIPLETLVTVLEDSPPSIVILGLFCLGPLLLGLAEFEG